MRHIGRNENKVARARFVTELKCFPQRIRARPRTIYSTVSSSP